MNEEHDMDILKAAWREAGAAQPPDLGRLVRRQSRLIRLHAAMEILVAIVFLGGSLWLALAMPTPEFVVLAVAVWIITLAALFSSLRNRAGTWGPAGPSTREFLDLSLRRCRSSLRGVRLGLWLLLIEVLFLAGWHAWYWSAHSPAPPLLYWLPAMCLPLAFLIGLLALRARYRREWTRLENMQHELFD
jgi:hypothetical protein